MAAVTSCSNFGAQENKICHCFHFFPFCLREVMGPDAMILVFYMLDIKLAFTLSSFTFIKRLFSWAGLGLTAQEIIISLEVAAIPKKSNAKESLNYYTIMLFSSSQFLPLKWYYLHIWGCWYFSWQSGFQLWFIQPGISWCTLHRS